MSKEETVEVGIANEGNVRVPISEAKEWDPKKVTVMSNYMHFDNGEGFVSMAYDDFVAIYNRTK